MFPTLGRFGTAGRPIAVAERNAGVLLAFPRHLPGRITSSAWLCDPYAPALRVVRIGVTVAYRGLGPAQGATLVFRGMATAWGRWRSRWCFRWRPYGARRRWATCGLACCGCRSTLLVNLPLLATVWVYLACCWAWIGWGRRPPGHAPLLLGRAQPSSRGRTPPERHPT